MVEDVAVLTLRGDIDSRSQQQMDDTLKDLEGRQIYKVVLDLSSIRFMGNQMLGLLVSHMKELRAGYGNIKLVNPQKTVVQYLKQNRLFEIFEIYSTRAEAIRSFHQDQPGAPPSQSQSAAEPAQPVSDAPSPSKQDSQEHENVTPVIREETDSQLGRQFETGEVLFVNSCMLATLIKMLESRGVLSKEEANDLLSHASGE